MQLHKETVKGARVYTFFLIAGIILVAFNLRPAITSVGPIVELIRYSLALSHWSVGLLTSLPLLAFFVVSPFVPRFANRIGNAWSLIIGLLFILIGISIRSLFITVFVLFLGTLLIGIGIAICNVLLPSVVKEKFPEKVGIMTSIYSTSIGVFASLASGISVPLAVNMNLGWQGSLGVWVIPTILALATWLYLAQFNQDKPVSEQVQNTENRMWKSLLAWQVALFFGFQSLLFYVTVTWFPEILVSKGYSMAYAGWLVSLIQIIGIPASIIVPMWAGRLRTQSWLGFGLGIMAAFGYGLILFSSNHFMILLSLPLIGLPLSGSFALGLALMAMRVKDASQSSELSGMSQSFGYLISAIGPILMGYLFDLTETWDFPLLILVVVSVLVALFGYASGRDRYI